jgi:hypothetical protein
MVISFVVFKVDDIRQAPKLLMAFLTRKAALTERSTYKL